MSTSQKTAMYSAAATRLAQACYLGPARRRNKSVSTSPAEPARLPRNNASRLRLRSRTSIWYILLVTGIFLLLTTGYEFGLSFRHPSRSELLGGTFSRGVFTLGGTYNLVSTCLTLTLSQACNFASNFQYCSEKLDQLFSCTYFLYCFFFGFVNK